MNLKNNEKKGLKTFYFNPLFLTYTHTHKNTKLRKNEKNVKQTWNINWDLIEIKHTHTHTRFSIED